MRKAKRTFINTPKANRVVGGYDFSHMGFAIGRASKGERSTSVKTQKKSAELVFVLTTNVFEW